MLENIEIENFRSVEGRATIPLAPITLLFGATAAGKSTLEYAICVLRNFVLNPTQALDGFFNLGFQSLGGFDACVFNHELDRKLKLGVTLKPSDKAGKFGVAFSKSGAEILLNLPGSPARDVDTPAISLRADVPIPYAVNQSFSETYEFQNIGFTVNWNGITANVVPRDSTPESQRFVQELAASLNKPAEALRKVDIAPAKRGFFKPSYTPVPLSPTATTDDEVATLIINDPNLPARISLDAERIFNRDFRTFVAPGTATFYFYTTEKTARTPVYLVNDGFGVNQVIYILAKLHRADVETLLIEEPEVHLHSTVVRNLARTFCSIVKEDRKQLILTTHSEQFLLSLLTCVSEGIIEPEMLKCYHVTRERRATAYHEQRVTPQGQIEGGLASFVEAETEDLKKFLSIAH